MGAGDGGGWTKGLGERTQPNSRSDESPWVLGARGIPLCLSPSSSSPSFPPSQPSLSFFPSPHYHLPLFPFKSLSSSISPLSRHHRDLSFPRFPLSLGDITSLLSLSIAAATAVATTPASPTLPNGVVFPLPLRNLQPARSPAVETAGHSPLAPSPPPSLSLFVDSLYPCRLLRPLAAPREWYIPHHFLLSSLPFSFLDRVLPFFLISCSPFSFSPFFSLSFRRIRWWVMDWIW